MTRIRTLLQKDLLLGIKDVFIILEVAFAVVIVLLLIFVMPEDIQQDSTIYIYDKTGILEEFIAQFAEEGVDLEGEFFVDSREAMIEGMTEFRSALGMIISESADGTYTIELLTQPYTNEQTVTYIKTEMEDLFSILSPPYGIYPADVYESVRIESLAYGLRDDLPFNKRLLPAIILMMVGIMGMFAMVSLIGQERGDLTLRAYMVSPGSIREFITSKHLTIMITGFWSFSVLYLPLMGFKGYPGALLIIMLTVLMGSGIGIILGTFFKEPMSGMLWVLLLMLIFSLPVISLFAPVFSPGWLKIIPSYHTLFGLDAAMFPDNNSHIIWQGALVLGIIDAVILPAATMILSRKLHKEV